MIANKRRTNSEHLLNKLHLFHGTDNLDAVRGISINNFDFRVSGKNATVYGDGAYFARDAKYSHSYTKGNERFMFQAVVLVGEYTRGDKSYRRPPFKPGNDHELYDSCVNNVDDPTIYIVFEKSQCYPEFLIQYTDTTDVMRHDVLSSRQSVYSQRSASPGRVRQTRPSSGIQTVSSFSSAGLTSSAVSSYSMSSSAASGRNTGKKICSEIVFVSKSTCL